MEIPKRYHFVLLTAMAMNYQVFLSAPDLNSLRLHHPHSKLSRQHRSQIIRNAFAQDNPNQPNSESELSGQSENMSNLDKTRHRVLQKMHMSNLGSLPAAVCSVLFAGLYRPVFAAVMGWVFIITKHFYGKYCMKSRKRKWTNFFSHLCCISTSLVFFYDTFKSLKTH